LQTRLDSRLELARYLGQRRRFYATFSHYGTRTVRIHGLRWGESWSRQMATLLFVDLKNEFGRELCDHLWFTQNGQFEPLALKPGDLVSFLATVTKYWKRDQYSDEYNRVQDFKLAFPRNVTILGNQPQERSYIPAPAQQATLD
jgi:hypothetical protein